MEWLQEVTIWRTLWKASLSVRDTANFVITVTQKVSLSIATVDCVPGGTWEVKLIPMLPILPVHLGQFKN